MHERQYILLFRVVGVVVVVGKVGGGAVDWYTHAKTVRVD